MINTVPESINVLGCITVPEPVCGMLMRGKSAAASRKASWYHWSCRCTTVQTRIWLTTVHYWTSVHDSNDLKSATQW